MTDRIACSLATDSRDPTVAVVWRNCSECPAIIVVSTTMLPLVESGEFVPACRRCMQRLLRADPNVEFMVHPWQVDQLADLGLLEYGRDVVVRANDAMRIRKKQRPR